jgi:hypothetical protein
MPAAPRRAGMAVAMAPLSEEALELALLAALLALLEALLADLDALLSLLDALLDMLLIALEMLLETELAEEEADDEADEPPVRLLRAEAGGFVSWGSLRLSVCVDGETGLELIVWKEGN